MSIALFQNWPRTITTIGLVALALTFALSGLRLSAWDALLPLFEWMEGNWFGYAGKTWGAVFAVVEACHLLGLALLGGAVFACDGKLLGVLFTGYRVDLIVRETHRIFVLGLVILLATGVFMACGVAMKIYYLPVFWYKMLALAAGILFTFGVKLPLLRTGEDALKPWLRRMLALTSLTIWLSVAATGRWIGFSG
ncbi:MAG: DUF6644 family protein [Halioglobus sp.]